MDVSEIWLPVLIFWAIVFAVGAALAYFVVRIVWNVVKLVRHFMRD